jgi:histidinol-phosphatase (PHP family)
MIDYHLHTKLCKHAQGEIDEYVEAAVSAGLSEIAFTDHIPLPDNYDTAHRMYAHEIDIYLNWVASCKEQYSEIQILTGIEADYIEGYESFVEAFIKQYDFDLVIMSVHFIRNWPEGNWVFNYSFPKRKPKDILTEYVDVLIKGINTGLFDVLGHADLIKLTGQSLILEIPEKIAELMQALQHNGMVIEFNTSGFRRQVQESYPGFDWIDIIKKYDIPVTTGSDAHHPDQVALKYDFLYKELRKKGIKALCHFNQRNQSFLPLL